MGLDQFDSIAERVGREGALDARDGLGVVLHLEAGRLERCDHCRKIVHDERRMRLLCRTEVGLDAEVELQRAAPEPVAAARREVRGFTISARPSTSP